MKPTNPGRGSEVDSCLICGIERAAAKFPECLPDAEANGVKLAAPKHLLGAHFWVQAIKFTKPFRGRPLAELLIKPARARGSSPRSRADER